MTGSPRTVYKTPMKKLLIFTGSGLSADSGLATFRGSSGSELWSNHSIHKVCDMLTWKSNVKGVHDFYNQRRVDVALAQPNAAHKMITEWQKRYDVKIITQNVDDLHERAGATDIIHVHGRLSYMKCLACGNEWEIGLIDWNPETDRCSCGSRKGVKPGVIFFNEHAPRYTDMLKAFKILTDGDLLVVVGTSGQVINIGSMTCATTARTVLLNLEADYSLDSCFDLVVHGRAVEKIGEVDAMVREHFGH